MLIVWIWILKIILFLILGILEDTGYLARGAMLIDKPLSKIGLNGRSFVPMLSGFACAIPAMMAARTIPNKRERLLTIFIIPLMSCSARLPVYALLIAYLTPRDSIWAGGLALAAIYIFSIVLFTLGCLCFVSEPLYRNLNLDSITPIIGNYMSKSNGSVFTILPWFGYSAFGAFLSTVFFRHVHRNKFKVATIITFFVVGYMLIYHSSWILIKLYGITDIELLKQSADYNYWITHTYIDRKTKNDYFGSKHI